MFHEHEFNSDPTREDRCGFPEVIYAEGKTPEQVTSIADRLLEAGEIVLATRANADHASMMRAKFGDELFWFERSGLLVIDRREDGIAAKRERRGQDVDAVLRSICAGSSGGKGNVVVCCAGTSDLPVAEEAVITARLMGSRAKLIADVGVAGVHRMLAHQDSLREAHAIVVVAGMEGALPTLVAGLVDVPVIAVPTSIGYGASFGGISALLGMLTSCAGGVSVVNIDNGFGAGQIADRINRPPARFALMEEESLRAAAMEQGTLDVPYGGGAIASHVKSWRDEIKSIQDERTVPIEESTPPEPTTETRLDPVASDSFRQVSTSSEPSDPYDGIDPSYDDDADPVYDDDNRIDEAIEAAEERSSLGAPPVDTSFSRQEEDATTRRPNNLFDSSDDTGWPYN